MKKTMTVSKTNNVFQVMVRSVVRDELVPIRKDIDVMKNDVYTMKSDILSMKDEILTELRAIREEQTMLSSMYPRLLVLEDKVEFLEKINAQGHRTG